MRDLAELVGSEISLVDYPANLRQYLVQKRATMTTPIEKMSPEEILSALAQAIDAGELDKAKMLMGHLKTAKMGFPPKKDEEDEMAKMLAMPTQKGMTPTALVDALPAVVRDFLKPALRPPEPVDVLKSLPEDIRKRLDTQETELAAMRDREKTAHFTEVAKGMKLNVPADKLADVLKRASNDHTLATSLGEVFDALSAQIAENDKITKTLGKAGGTLRPAGTDSEVAVQKRADEIRKADPKLTKHQAFAQAAAENPEAYRESLSAAR